MKKAHREILSEFSDSEKHVFAELHKAHTQIFQILLEIGTFNPDYLKILATEDQFDADKHVDLVKFKPHFQDGQFVYSFHFDLPNQDTLKFVAFYETNPDENQEVH